MTQEAAVPGQYLDQVRRIAREEVAEAFRAAPLRNATISDGGLTLKGGFLRLIHKTFNLFYVGPTGSPLGDGSYQQVIRLRRSDGTMALQIHDAFPDGDGTLNQAMTWWDRSGNIVLADDTDSGQGIARPWLSGGFGRARFADMTVSTTASEFETLWEARVTKQQPKMLVAYKATMDTSGATGETRVMVNGAQLGPTGSEGFVVMTRYVGAAAIAGAHMSDLIVEIQGRRTSASGALRVEALGWETRQT